MISLSVSQKKKDVICKSCGMKNCTMKMCKVKNNTRDPRNDEDEIIEKPFSPACENRLPILEKLKDLLKEVTTFFEIGSGTGQHALFF